MQPPNFTTRPRKAPETNTQKVNLKNANSFVILNQVLHFILVIF